MEQLNAVTLKNELWETLKDIKNNRLEASKGDAIAAQAREILRTVNTQVKIVDKAKEQIPQDLIDFAIQK